MQMKMTGKKRSTNILTKEKMNGGSSKAQKRFLERRVFLKTSSTCVYILHDE